MFKGIMFLQLWPVIYSGNKRTIVDLRAMARKKIKLEEEAISEILVADATLELGAEARGGGGGRRQQASVEVAITNTGQ
jgi:hypothetical protein